MWKEVWELFKGIFTMTCFIIGLYVAALILCAIAHVMLGGTL